jgi:hypothetical protein
LTRGLLFKNHVAKVYVFDHIRHGLCLVAAIAIAWGLSWLLDFSLSKLLKISVADLQALLIAGLAMLLIGLGVFLCT